MINKRNIVSVVVVILLSSVLGTTAVFLIISLMRNSFIGNEIAQKSKVIEQYVQRSKMPITKDSIAYLLDQRDKLKSVKSRLGLAFASPLRDKITEEETDPLQFKERLHQIQKKVREDAAMHGLILPQSLGFDADEKVVPYKKDIPSLKRRLDILEEVVYLMVSSRVSSLEEITFAGGPVRKAAGMDMGSLGAAADGGNPSGEASLPEGREGTIGLSLRFVCSRDAFVNLLYNIRMSSYFLVVDDVAMAAADNTGPAAGHPAASGTPETDKGLARVALTMRALIFE